MSKRKARDEGNQPTRPSRPVLYYPADDNTGSIQCVMPATSPISTPRASPVRGRSTSKDIRKPSPVKDTSFIRRRRSALDHIGYEPEDIPTPRTRTRSSLFTTVTRASGSSSKPFRTFAATATSPIRSPPKPKRASTDSSDHNSNPDRAESEYVVDSSDGDVPTRRRSSRRASKQTSSGPSPQESPRSNKQPSPRSPQRTSPRTAQSSPRTAQSSPTRPRNMLDWVTRTPAASSPFRARVVPIEPQRRKRPSESSSIYSGLRSSRISRAKRPRISNPTPAPAPDPEIIVVSSSESEVEPIRSVSGSPSLGGNWPSRSASPSGRSTPTPSSRSSDIILLDSPPAPDDEIQELPGRNRSSPDEEGGSQIKGRGRGRQRRIDSSPAQEQEQEAAGPSEEADSPTEATKQRHEEIGLSQPPDETNPFLLSGDKGRYRSVSSAVASGSGLSRTSPFAYRLLPSGRPLFRPSTTASGPSSLNGTPRPSATPARENASSVTPVVMRMSLPRLTSPTVPLPIQVDLESETESSLAPTGPVLFGKPVLLLEGLDVPKLPPDANILPQNVPVMASGEPNPQPEDPRASSSQSDEPVPPPVVPDAPVLPSREPILVLDEPTSRSSEPIILLDDPTPPPPEAALRQDECITLPEEPNPSSNRPVSPHAASIPLPTEPTRLLEPMPPKEPLTSPLTPVPALEEPAPTAKQPADPSSRPRPKPRVLRLDCVLLPRASKAARKALARSSQNTSRTSGYPKGKGKSVAALVDAGLLSEFEVEKPMRKVDKGKGVARGEKRRRRVDSSPSPEEDIRDAETEDTDEYQDSEGDGVQVMTEDEYEVDDDSPGPSSPKKRGKRPRPTDETSSSPEPGPSKQDQPVKYLIVDPRIASPSMYDSLTPEMMDTPNRYCHCCRTRSSAGKLKMLCTNLVSRRLRSRKPGPRRECGTAWCQRCIAKHDIVFNPIQPDFTCPWCTNSCECDVCRRDRGQPPIGRGAWKVVKQKPGRRSLKHVVAASAPTDDQEDSAPATPTTEEPPIVNPGPSSSEPGPSVARRPVPVTRGPITWHGRHTPPPLRARRASGAPALSTGEHIFVPRRPQERESRSRETSQEDPDVDVEGTDSNSGALLEGVSRFDEMAEQLDEDEDGSSEWEDKMRTFEGDYSGAADTTVLGADSVSFDIHPEIDDTEPRGEGEDDEITDLHYVYESSRASIDPEAQTYDGQAHDEADVHVGVAGEDEVTEHNLRALEEAILSLGQASPTRLHGNDAILEGLDAGIEDARRHFYGSDMPPDRQPTQDPDPAIDMAGAFGGNVDAYLTDEYLLDLDLGLLHPDGTFAAVPVISMSDVARSASHDSFRDISLFDAASDHHGQAESPSMSLPHFAQHVGEFNLSPSQPTHASESRHDSSHEASQYEPQPSLAPLPTSDALPALQLDVDSAWPPETELDPLPLLFDPEPELVTATDPESTKSTILGTPSPQLENSGYPVAVATDNLFEDLTPTPKRPPRIKPNPTSDLNLVEDRNRPKAPPRKSRAPRESTRPSNFVLPSQEQQANVGKVLRSGFRIKPPASNKKSEEVEKGKFLRSRRQYGVYS